MSSTPLPPVVPSSDSQTRRSFLKQTALAAAGVSATGIVKESVYGQNTAPSAGRVIGANDRIAFGYIGVGARGSYHLDLHKQEAGDFNITQAAVCDVYDKHAQKAQAEIGVTSADVYRDHRRLLERKDIDAVLIATIDPWHADIAIDALEAGKHVYLEKPMSRYLDEAFRLYDTVKRTGKTFCLGSQGCADPKYHKSAEWIKAGKIGPLVWGQASYSRNNWPKSEWTYPVEADATEATLDWNRWLGRCPKVPFDPNRYFSWHKYYHYNSGIIGNLLPHRFNPMILALGNVEFPRRVVCTGTRKISLDRDITDTTHLLAEFPCGFTLLVTGSTVNEQGLPDVIRGLKGTISFTTSQNKLEMRPERPFSEELDADSFSSPLPVDNVTRLTKSFLEGIRNGATPFAHADLAIRAHTVLCLAEQAERMSLTLLFDDKTRQISTGDGKIIPALNYDTPMTLPKWG